MSQVSEALSYSQAIISRIFFLLISLNSAIIRHYLIFRQNVKKHVEGVQCACRKLKNTEEIMIYSNITVLGFYLLF